MNPVALPDTDADPPPDVHHPRTRYGGGVPDRVARHSAGAFDLKGVPGPRTLVRVTRATAPAP